MCIYIYSTMNPLSVLYSSNLTCSISNFVYIYVKVLPMSSSSKKMDDQKWSLVFICLALLFTTSSSAEFLIQQVQFCLFFSLFRNTFLIDWLITKSSLLQNPGHRGQRSRVQQFLQSQGEFWYTCCYEIFFL